MDILNFISWIRGSKLVSSVDASKTLIPLGVKNNRRDDDYVPVTMTVQDLASSLGGDRLVAGTREVVLTDNGGDAELTFNPGTAVIQTSSPGDDLYIRTLGGDDIILESGDDIRLQGDQGLYDDEAEGGDINIYAGNGSDGDLANAGPGGDIRLEAGDGGISNSGSGNVGGFITIQGGYTTEAGIPGGDISIVTGSSVSGISGDFTIEGSYQWIYNTNNASIVHPTINLINLINPTFIPGARAMINDSSVPAAGNFGTIASSAVGGFIVPVFSDGTNWLIG